MASKPGGKGSTRRPSEVATDVVDNNWDRIFGKKAPEPADSALEKNNEQPACRNACPGCTCQH